MLTPLQIAPFAISTALGSAGLAGLAAGGYAYAALWPASQIFGRAMRAPRIAEDGLPEIALTFDDGPHPRWTPMLLELLAQHQVSATFFLVGKYAVHQQTLVRQIQAAGHLIGNHSWTHPNLSLANLAQTRTELERTSHELEQTLGTPVRFFRPPFGARRPGTFGLARQLGLTPVLWNGITTDWTATDPEPVTDQMSKLIADHNRRGYASNLVLHDGGHLTLEVDRSASVRAAGQLMERFRASHRFVRLDKWAI